MRENLTMTTVELWGPRVYTKSGFVKTNILEGVRALDVGCGDRKLPGSTGIDRLALPSVDIVHDLDVLPWPIKDGEYDLVFANHFLEHTNDVLSTLGEMHRILAPGGRVLIQVPYFRCTDAFSDPTHLHFFTAATLDYVCEGTRLGKYEYTPFKFKKIGFWYGWPHRSKNVLKELIKSFAHNHPDFYDQYASLLIPTECLTWELEKIA